MLTRRVYLWDLPQGSNSHPEVSIRKILCISYESTLNSLFDAICVNPWRQVESKIKGFFKVKFEKLAKVFIFEVMNVRKLITCESSCHMQFAVCFASFDRINLLNKLKDWRQLARLMALNYARFEGAQVLIICFVRLNARWSCLLNKRWETGYLNTRIKL